MVTLEERVVYLEPLSSLHDSINGVARTLKLATSVAVVGDGGSFCEHRKPPIGARTLLLYHGFHRTHHGWTERSTRKEESLSIIEEALVSFTLRIGWFLEKIFRTFVGVQYMLNLFSIRVELGRERYTNLRSE